MLNVVVSNMLAKLSRISVIVLAFIAVLGLASFPEWHDETSEAGSLREVRNFPSRGISNLAFGALVIAGLLQVICSVWQHVAAAASTSLGKAFNDQGAGFHVGKAAIGLCWSASFLILFTAFALRVMLDSVVVLSTMVEDNDDMYILLQPRGQ